MITRDSLPVGYKPYGHLNVCSNILIGGGNLIAIGNLLPILIGKGDLPLVWLQAPTDQTGENFSSLVEASVATHPAVSVTSDQTGLSVLVGGRTVLRVRAIEPDAAIVDLLDLRPIGYNVFGDANALNAGGARFTGNTFAGGGTLLAIGGTP